MRGGYLVLLLVVLPSLISGYNGSLDMDIDFYEEYCNCDDDCGVLSSCLTESTDGMIKDLSSQSDNKIEEANDEGFRGICVQTTIDDELTVFQMSTDCSALETEEEEEIETENEEENESERIITIQFDDDTNESDEEQEENNEVDETKIDINQQIQNELGGINMDIIAALVIAGTIVLIGFFGLMAWIAYLLQKKAPEGKK